MENWQVGDRVIVRTVKEMIESGLFEPNTDRRSDLILDAKNATDFGFNKHMQYLCGQTGVIYQIANLFHNEIKIEFDDHSITLDRSDGGSWYISAGMVKRQEYTTSDNNVASFLDELFSEL